MSFGTSLRSKLSNHGRLAVFLALAGGIAVGTVLAVHDLGLFELDRNALEDLTVSGDDWETLHMGFGSAADFTGILADVAPMNPLGSTGTQFQAGGSKDDLDVGPGGATGQHWKWEPGEPLDKDDITNAYAAAYTNAIDTGLNNIGDLIIYFGLDRFANNGSAQVGFWFFQNEIGLTTTPSGGGYLFSGLHEVGDVLVQSNFTQGGVVENISVFEWVGSGGSHGTLNLRFSAADCIGPPVSPGDDPACATVNRGDQTAPWPYTPKFGSPGTFPQGSFFEGGINITRLVPEAGCFSSFLAETRTSTPFDARLKDFALGSFELCQLVVIKDGDTLSKVGDDVAYTITIQNTGAITLYKQSIEDTLLGDLTDGTSSFITASDCGNSLAPGGSCTIELTRTVLAGDPDPLTNTVEVIYDSSADLLGDEVSQTDDHSVELFEPAVEVDKTGPTLSKVDDEVTYTYTIYNRSSSDSPDLILDSVMDSGDNNNGDGLGDLTAAASGAGCGTLTADDGDDEGGDDQCTFDVNYTVQEGDDDPLNNTVDVDYHPEGFPNNITSQDDHEINLFQPSVAVAKTGDALSKVGDPVDYVITLSNTSSSDTPDLTCTATDSLLGVVFGPAVLPLGDTVISLNRVVQENDPDPLVNTVNMSCSVAGFPNMVDALPDSHSTELFQPDVEVIKTGPSSALVGQTITYDFTIENLSSEDSPNLVLDSVTDTVLGDLTAAASAAGCTTLAAPSGSCSFSFDYTVQASDPDTLTNVVTVHYHPEGFPNDVTDMDDHSVTVIRGRAQITPTGTECEDFLAGTATDLQFLELSGGGQLSPGAFIQFAEITLPSGESTVQVSVVSDPLAAADPLAFDVKLYTFDEGTGACQNVSNQPGVSISLVDNVVTYTIPAQYDEVITYVKYSSPNDNPAVGTTYTFTKTLNGIAILTDSLVVVDNE